MTAATATHRAPSAGADQGASGNGPRRFRHSLVSREVLRFVAGAMAAAIAVGVGTFVVIGQDAETEAIRVARTITEVEGHSVVEPAITDPLLHGMPLAIASFDSLVRGRILAGAVVRMKLWDADGRIVYSDEHRLIGRRFSLDAGETAALRGGPAEAGVSDLQQPENLYERGFGKLLQVYLQLVTPSGQPLLFETYQRYEAISTYQSTVWSSFLPILAGGLLLLFIITLPLALSLARRLRSSLSDREALLLRALGASERERTRIAGDLHDGVVQSLAAVTYSLSATSRRLRGGGRTAGEDEVASIEAAASATRRAMKELRTLVVEITPANLVAGGLSGALRDLLEPLSEQGLLTSIAAPERLELSAERTAVLFRVAQESLRNVSRHAAATRVDLRLRESRDNVALEIADDGRGFDAADIEQRRAQGHVGLSLLRELVADAGGALSVTSSPAAGTLVTAEIPRR